MWMEHEPVPKGLGTLIDGIADKVKELVEKIAI